MGLASLLERAKREVGAMGCGLWDDGGDISLTDVMAGPCTCSTRFCIGNWAKVFPDI